MRVEWAKTYARVTRFDEEVELVLEEMRRALRFFGWRSSWWRLRENIQPIDGYNSELVVSGRLAYARKQASISEKLASKFRRLWLSALSENKLPAHLLG